MKSFTRLRIRVVLAIVGFVPVAVAVLGLGALAQTARDTESQARSSAIDLDAFIALRTVQSAADAELYLFFGWVDFVDSHPSDTTPVSVIHELTGVSLLESSTEALRDAFDSEISSDATGSLDQIERGLEDARAAFLASDSTALDGAADTVREGIGALDTEAEMILSRHDYAWVAVQDRADYARKVAAEVALLGRVTLSPSTEERRAEAAMASSLTDEAYRRFALSITEQELAAVEAGLAASPMSAWRLAASSGNGEFGNMGEVFPAIEEIDAYFDITEAVRQSAITEIEDDAAESVADAQSEYRMLLLVAAALAVFSGVSVFVVGRSLSKRLENLARAALSLSNGELGARIEDDAGHDEVAVVAQAFNDLSTTMETSYQQIRTMADGQYEAEILDHELPGPLGKTLRLAIRRLSNAAVELAHHASHDRLTGLLDRRGLDQHLMAWTSETGSIAVIDLDGFKAVNDTYGHEAGDAVLVAVATRLRSSCRSEDVLARLGGDEFVIASDVADPEAFALLADRVVESICQPVSWLGSELVVSASVGTAEFDSSDHWGVALREADEAMFQAKRSGKNQVIAAERPDRPFPEPTHVSASGSV